MIQDLLHSLLQKQHMYETIYGSLGLSLSAGAVPGAADRVKLKLLKVNKKFPKFKYCVWCKADKIYHMKVDNQTQRQRCKSTENFKM